MRQSDMGTAPPIDPNSRLFTPRYAYAEADRIAGVSRGTAKRWLAGYTYHVSDGSRRFSGPVTQWERPNGGVSFADLVEIAAINRWKDLRYSLRNIREIVDECQEIFEVERPLITLRFKANGRYAFVERKDGNLVGLLGAKRQRAWDEILNFLETVEYEGDFVTKWWPLGKDTPVIVDPDYGFGLPVIDGIGLRTEIVLERMQAGESETEIAADFRVPVELIAGAMQFEVSRLPAPQ